MLTACAVLRSFRLLVSCLASLALHNLHHASHHPTVFSTTKSSMSGTRHDDSDAQDAGIGTILDPYFLYFCLLTHGTT